MEYNIKVLIGDDTLECGIPIAKCLRNLGINAITKKKDGKILYESICMDKPDVVVMDVVLPSMNVIDLMKKVNQSLSSAPAFIVTSAYQSSILEKQIMENGASYFMLKPYDIYILGKKILSLPNVVKSRSRHVNELEVSVTNVFQKLGIPAHIKGYYYLRSAIIASIENPKLLESVTKLLYPYVAEQFSATPAQVERAIRHAIELAWDRGYGEALNEFLGYTVNPCKNKPTNSEFITLVADKMRMQREITSNKS